MKREKIKMCTTSDDYDTVDNKFIIKYLLVKMYSILT